MNIIFMIWVFKIKGLNLRGFYINIRDNNNKLCLRSLKNEWLLIMFLVLNEMHNSPLSQQEISLMYCKNYHNQSLSF